MMASEADAVNDQRFDIARFDIAHLTGDRLRYVLVDERAR